MKIFFSEFIPNYSKYHFPYQIWLLKEENDDLGKIYESGFLPIRNMLNIFYLSRNIRVDLSSFETSSENRRILKKTEDVVSEFVLLKDFKYTPEIQKLCKEYAEKRLGKDVFPVAAVRNVFEKKVYNSVFVFKEKESGKEIGYAVCFEGKDFLQYTHSFYDLNYLDQNLGARMMLEAILWAKEKNKKYIYLGTCYEEKAMYKTEFKGVEFFNGFTWSSNLNELKALVNRVSEDYLLRDKNFLEIFYKELPEVLSKYGIRINL